MPDVRYFHRRHVYAPAHDALTDFEARVWHHYVLLADDFGLTPLGGIQTASPRLARARNADVQRAFQRISETALWLRYEVAAIVYVCSPTWQDDQGLRYGRPTYHPCPPNEILRQCSIATQEMFQKLFRNASDEVSEILQKSSEPRARTRKGVRSTDLDLDLDLDLSEESTRGGPPIVAPSWPMVSVGQVRLSVTELVERWNLATKPPFVPISLPLSATSERHVIRALQEHPDLDWWAKQITAAAGSAFCAGGGERGWVADFWWLLEHADEVASGRYRDRMPTAKPTKAQAISESNRAATKRVLAMYEAQKP